MGKQPFPRTIIAFTVFTFLLFSAFPVFGDEYFVIDRYRINIEVLESNTYMISETIEVTFQTERHGIYRNIPSRYNGRPVRITDISVPGWETDISRSADEVTIRIGSADVYVSGKQSYTISYTYDVGADAFDDMDEFYHNLIGDQWDTTIESADFRIRMPSPFDASGLNFTSGSAGSTESGNVEWSVSGNTITGRITSPLGPYEALTAALPLAEGYWKGAVLHREPGELIFRVFGYPLYVTVIILSFLLWYRNGRDKKLYPAVEFEAPEGMNPAEIGYIIDGKVDSRDVTALIIYWAERGLIEIEEETRGKAIFKQKVLHLTRLKELGGSAEDYEKEMFSKLFEEYGSGGHVTTKDLENKFYKTLSSVRKKIMTSFTNDPERMIYEKGRKGITALTALFAALPVMLILMEGFTRAMGPGIFGAVFAIPFSLFLIIPAFMLSSALTGPGGIRENKGRLLFSFLFGGFSFLFFAAFVVLAGGVPLIKYFSAAAGGIIVSIFVNIMSRRTAFGDRMLEKTLGFKEFIKTAEKEKLEMMFESDPRYFFNILPYAMAMGLTQKWASHFEGMALQPPEWYRGYSRAGFSAAAFGDSLQNSFNTINTSMASSPSSGGSSSGGSSGGGSGGGGGGSW